MSKHFIGAPRCSTGLRKPRTYLAASASLLVTLVGGCGEDDNGPPAADCWGGPKNGWPPTCWRPYSKSSAFNRKVPTQPKLLANSAAIMDRVLGTNDPIPKDLKPNNFVAHTNGS
jgi:hypothetical protein